MTAQERKELVRENEFFANFYGRERWEAIKHLLPINRFAKLDEGTDDGGSSSDVF